MTFGPPTEPCIPQLGAEDPILGYPAQTARLDVVELVLNPWPCSRHLCRPTSTCGTLNELVHITEP